MTATRLVRVLLGARGRRDPHGTQHLPAPALGHQRRAGDFGFSPNGVFTPSGRYPGPVSRDGVEAGDYAIGSERVLTSAH